MATTKIVRDGARLVSFALRPKLAAGADEEYARLCGEYRVDAEFRDVVDAVVTGLGLNVLALTDYGLVIAPESDSVFEFRLADYAKRSWDQRMRLLTGLAHVGIAAACYPREDDLESDHVVRRTVLAVEALITEVCRQHAEGAEDRDAAGDPDVVDVWELWSATPQTRTTRGGGYAADCRLGIIGNAFEWLESQGFAKQVKPVGTFQVNDRYRIQIRDLAGSDTLDRLRDGAAAAAGTVNGSEQATDAEVDGAGVPT